MTRDLPRNDAYNGGPVVPADQCDEDYHSEASVQERKHRRSAKYGCQGCAPICLRLCQFGNDVAKVLPKAESGLGPDFAPFRLVSAPTTKGPA
jgi:hypothetical protein